MGKIIKHIKRRHLFYTKKDGFTLVEVVVSIALLAIVLTVMADGFMTGLSFLGMARSKTQRSMNTAGGVAQITASSNVTANTYGSVTTPPATTGNFTITFNGIPPISVNGSYYTGTDGDVTYKSFVPSN